MGRRAVSDQDVTDDSSYTGDCSRKGGVLQDITDRYNARATVRACVHACLVACSSLASRAVAASPRLRSVMSWRGVGGGVSEIGKVLLARRPRACLRRRSLRHILLSACARACTNALHPQHTLARAHGRGHGAHRVCPNRRGKDTASDSSTRFTARVARRDRRRGGKTAALSGPARDRRHVIGGVREREGGGAPGRRRRRRRCCRRRRSAASR